MLRIPIQHRPAALTFADDDLQLEVLIDHLGEVLPPKWSTQTYTHFWDHFMTSEELSKPQCLAEGRAR